MATVGVKRIHSRPTETAFTTLVWELLVSYCSACASVLHSLPIIEYHPRHIDRPDSVWNHSADRGGYTSLSAISSRPNVYRRRQ